MPTIWMKWEARLACKCEADGRVTYDNIPEPGDTVRCTVHGVQEIVGRVMARGA